MQPRLWPTRKVWASGLADVLVKGKLPRGRAWFVGIGHGE